MNKKIRNIIYLVAGLFMLAGLAYAVTQVSDTGTTTPSITVDTLQSSGSSITLNDNIEAAQFNIMNVSTINYYRYTDAGDVDDIQVKLDSCDGVNECTVVVTPGNYTLDYSITPRHNTHIIFMQGAKFYADPNFNTTSDDHLLTLHNDNITVTGGYFNGMQRTAPGGFHFSVVNIRGKNIIVEKSECANPGQGDDSCFMIDDGANNVRLDHTFAHDVHSNHAYQIINSSDIIISESIAQNVAQDAFRTYQGASRIHITDSIAIDARAGFQTWPLGNRDLHISDCIAVRSETYGFVIQSLDSSCVGCISINASSYGLLLSGNLNTIQGFISHQDHRPALITGNYNTFAGLTGEGNITATYAINITGDNNFISGVSIYRSGPGLYDIHNSGNNNAIMKIDGYGLLNLGDQIAVNTSIFHTNDLHTNITFTNDRISFYAGGVRMLMLSEAAADEFIVNQDSNDINLRVKSTGDPNMLQVDAGLDTVGIGTGTPNRTLTVDGPVWITGVSSDGAGYAVCVTNNGDLGTCTDAVGAGGTCTCT